MATTRKTPSPSTFYQSPSSISPTTPLLTSDDRLNNLIQLDHGSATIVSCVANLSNTILGTGMLAMAHGFAEGGLVLGASTVIGCGLMAYLGLYLLALCAAHPNIPHRRSSFAEISKATYPRAGAFFDAAIAIKCFGVSISYLLIFGRLMPQVSSLRLAFMPLAQLRNSSKHLFQVVMSFQRSASLDSSSVLLDRKLWITLAMVPIVPLSLLRTLDSLRYTSYIALIAVVDLVIVVIYKFFDRTGLEPAGEIRLLRLNPGFLTSLPVYVFA